MINFALKGIRKMGEGLHDRTCRLNKQNAVTAKSWPRRKWTTRINIPISLSLLHHFWSPLSTSHWPNSDRSWKTRWGRWQMKRMDFKDNSSKHYVLGTVQNAIHILTYLSSQQPYELGTFPMVLILQTGKVRHRVVMKSAQSHTSSKWQRTQDMNSGRLAQGSILLTLKCSS